MLFLPSILWDPNIFLYEGDFISVRWYSVLFILGFVIGRFLVVSSYKREKRYDTTVDLQMLYMVFGILIGSRLGHVIFYEPEILSRGIQEIFFFWKGGLASHGAAIGILSGMALYSFKIEINSFKINFIDRLRRGYNYLQVMDRMIIAVAIGCALIRLGNFVNSETIGLQTQSNYGLLFVNPTEDRIKQQLPFVKKVSFYETGDFYKVGQPLLNTKIFFDNEEYKEDRIKESVKKTLITLHPEKVYANSSIINPLKGQVKYTFKRNNSDFYMEYETVGIYRHPAQLYESLIYFIIGIIMFIVLHRNKINLRHGSLLAFFFVTAFGGRFFLEYFKENQVKNELLELNNLMGISLNLGQLLSIPFVLVGIYMFYYNRRSNSFFVK
jgi:prolipoprotein diacylglyceryl transferase